MSSEESASVTVTEEAVSEETSVSVETPAVSSEETTSTNVTEEVVSEDTSVSVETPVVRSHLNLNHSRDIVIFEPSSC